MSLTQYVASFVSETTLDSIPDKTVERAKFSLVDGFGLAVAGSRSAAARIATDYVGDLGCRGQARALGSGVGMPARFAAFVNGISIHADDYDDTQLAVAPDRVYGLLTHPTAPVLAAVLSSADAENMNGAVLLRAYVVGVEVATKVAEAMAPRHYEDGFHSTGTAGSIGAAAGVANLQGLDPPATARALSLAASQAAGLRENFGTMTKPFHAGRAAESGVVAVDLVRRGWTAAKNILEADRGFFRAAGGGYEPKLIEAQLGAPWTFNSPGISIKPHPSGSLTHPAMGALLALLVDHDVDAREINSITVGTSRHMPNALIHHHPKTELEAKFSMEYCLAVIALDRRAGLAEFTDERVNRGDVQELLGRVVFTVEPEIESAGYQTMDSVVSVVLADGRVLSAREGFAKGSPHKPMSRNELVSKFRECVTWGGFEEAARADALADRLFTVEGEPTVRALVDATIISTT